MADLAHLAVLARGVDVWNRWRDATASSPVDLSGADLNRAKLNHANLLRADLTGADLGGAQMEHTHLKDADLTGASLERANLEHTNARGACFDVVQAHHATFEVATLRGARFRDADLQDARFHRAYLRDTDLRGADLSRAWLRLAVLEGADCRRTTFDGADLRHASLVRTDLRGATMSDVQVYGVSAWDLTTDADTRQDLVVSVDAAEGRSALRTTDLHTAQLLALMLDGSGVRRVFESVTSKLVLLLGSFGPAEKPVLDALRTAIRSGGYVAVVFDFERPAARDYAETVIVLAGMSRFVVADFTNAKEVRAEVLAARQQYRRVPIIPIAAQGVQLPVTAVNYLDPDELELLVRYSDVDDLVGKVQTDIIGPAEVRADRIAAAIARAESIVGGSAP